MSLRKVVTPFNLANIPGCVLYVPLWKTYLRGSSFRSLDKYGHSCAVTGATWGSQGRNFDGTDDYTDCGSGTSLDITGQITLAAWVKIGTSSGDIRFALGKGQSTSRRAYFLLFVVATGVATIYITSDGSSSTKWGRPTSTAINDDVWHFITGTFTPSGSLNMYRDGVLNNGTAEGSAQASIYDSSDNLRIGHGNKGDTTNYWGGIIGEVLIFNRALSASEIANIYRNTRWRYS